MTVQATDELVDGNLVHTASGCDRQQDAHLNFNALFSNNNACRFFMSKNKIPTKRQGSCQQSGRSTTPFS
jgi:hypothetical protein